MGVVPFINTHKATITEGSCWGSTEVRAMRLEEVGAGPTTHFRDSQGTTGPRGRDTGHWSQGSAQAPEESRMAMGNGPSRGSRDESFRSPTWNPLGAHPSVPQDSLKD